MIKFLTYKIHPFPRNQSRYPWTRPLSWTESGSWTLFFSLTRCTNSTLLKNIYKELQSDCNFTPPNHGFLTGWAKQGVLLLNNTLTVEHGKAGSHAQWGWEQFTQYIIQAINSHLKDVIFVVGIMLKNQYL